MQCFVFNVVVLKFGLFRLKDTFQTRFQGLHANKRIASIIHGPHDNSVGMFGFNIPIQLQASIALLFSQLSFSGWHILGSVSFHGGADPLIFCMYRIVLGTSLMHAYVRHYGMSMVIDPEDYLRFFFLGVLSFLSMILTAFCLTYIAPSRFAIFQPSIPCIVAGLSMISGFEQLCRLKIIGIVVAVGGAVLAEMWKFQAIDSAELDIPLGTGLAIGQVLSMSVLLVGVKPLLSKYQPAVVSCVYFTVATVATILLCLARIDTFPPGAFYFHHQFMPWVALVYAAVFTTLFAFIALSWGGKYLNPSASTAYFTFQPLGTIVLSAIILGSVVTLPEVVGGSLIIVGLGITSAATLLGPAEDGSSSSEEVGNPHIIATTVSIIGMDDANNDMHTGTHAVAKNTMFANTASVLSTSPIDLMRSAYKNRSLLPPTSPTYAYNPLNMDESVDIEMGEISLKKGESVGVAELHGMDEGSTRWYTHSNKNITEAGDHVCNPRSELIPTSPDSVQDLSAHNVPIVPIVPIVRVVSAHSTHNMHMLNPVRQRPITVDSSPSTGTLHGTTLLLNNGVLKRNQNSFNA